MEHHHRLASRAQLVADAVDMLRDNSALTVEAAAAEAVNTSEGAVDADADLQFVVTQLSNWSQVRVSGCYKQQQTAVMACSRS